MDIANMIICLLLIHWLADFVFQRNVDAQNKWHSNLALLKHTLMYSAVFILFTVCMMDGYWNQINHTGLVWFFIVVCVTHFAIDRFTSIIVHNLYKQEDHHNMFVIIGLDQFLHTAIMINCLKVLVYQ